MTTTSTPSRRTGGLLLWFAVVGGAGAWTVHLLAVWSIEELTCAAGGRDVAGVPLVGVLAIVVVVPAAVAAAALLVSWLAWRRLSAAAVDDRDPGRAGADGLGRARMLARIGLGANLLFLSIIAAGGAALLVFPPCSR